MALSIVFASGAAVSRSIGPLSRLCLDGEVICDKPGGEVLGRHHDHEWHVAGSRYSRMDCAGSLTVRFERRGTGDKSVTFGPFLHFSLVGGIAYVDGSNLAFIDERQAQWFCYHDGQAWSTMFIEGT